LPSAAAARSPRGCCTRCAASATGRSSLIDALRPFLVCRILGVFSLCTLDGPDAVLRLAKLAQLCQPGMIVDDLLADLAAPERPAAPALTVPNTPDAAVAFSLSCGVMDETRRATPERQMCRPNEENADDRTRPRGPGYPH
jgi:hypothetical protein